ncbi:MAG TPA: hypothetical protein VGH20_16495 [Myxococcales bacterium]|jgi:hypothetical protein
MQQGEVSVDPHETLFVTARKRFVPVYNPAPEGQKALVLYCGLQEISFDEPELFPWAEKLIQQDSFMAGAATTWAEAPLEWPRVKGLLESLVQEGVLSRTPPHATIAQLELSSAHAEWHKTDAERPHQVGAPRMWNPDPGSVLREVTGRDLEPGYVEAIMPVHRLAHPVLDREGRQVGEINVYPDALRLKIPTEWKTCNYAGTRYHDDMPMNMTALRSMLAHWKPVLRATLGVREEFLRRYPQYPDGTWKLGEVHFLACSVLALVSYQVMRWKDPVQNGELDPVLSSLFRVIDGVRMISGHMLDLYERPMFHDTPVTPRDITGAVEREDLYRSGRGVCAGPQSMIDELVETALNGKPVEGGAEPAPSWMADIPIAVDYALWGLLDYAALATLWVRMGEAYTRVRETLERLPKDAGGKLAAFRRTIFTRDWQPVWLSRTYLPAQRDMAYPFYVRMFKNAQRGIRGLPPEHHQDLSVLLTPPEGLLGDGARRAYLDLFASAEDPAFAGANAKALQEVAGHVFDYLRYERNLLRTVTYVQRGINTLLGRPQPKLPLSGTQLAGALALRRTTPNRGFFYLPETVQEVFGISVENTKDATTVAHGERSIVLH